MPDVSMQAFGGNNTAGPIDIATAVNAHGGPCGRMDFESETFVTAFNARQDPIDSPDCALPLDTDGSTQAIAFSEVTHSLRADGFDASEDGTGRGTPLVSGLGGMAVRRLTPRECERLQGYEDDYTLIPGAADGPRYKALGNAMAVPVISWIGRRIQAAIEGKL